MIAKLRYLLIGPDDAEVYLSDLGFSARARTALRQLAATEEDTAALLERPARFLPLARSAFAVAKEGRENAWRLAQRLAELQRDLLVHGSGPGHVELFRPVFLGFHNRAERLRGILTDAPAGGFEIVLRGKVDVPLGSTFDLRHLYASTTSPSRMRVARVERLRGSTLILSVPTSRQRDAEKRTASRLPVDLGGCLLYPDRPNLPLARVRVLDLSEGGACIAADTPLVEGETVFLSFDDQPGQTIAGEAVVSWVLPESEESRLVAGLSFRRMEPRSRRFLLAIVRRAAATSTPRPAA